MAFKSLREFRPNLGNVEPRVNSSFAINSSLCVVSITYHKRYSELINEKKTVMDTKMLGIIGNLSQNETLSVSDLYDIGNKNPISVSGKMSGSIALDSSIIESVNLLGSIYETILIGLQKKYNDFGYTVKLNEEVMFTPSINTAYNADPVQDPDTLDGNNLIAQSATPDDNMDPSKGAIMLTLDDLRLRVKFGLCLTFFQESKRLGSQNAFKVKGIKGSILESDFPQFDALNAFNTSYEMTAGVFLENCIITSQSRTITSSPEGGGINENVIIRYSGAKNVRPNLFISESAPIEPGQPQ